MGRVVIIFNIQGLFKKFNFRINEVSVDGRGRQFGFLSTILSFSLKKKQREISCSSPLIE